MAFSGTEYLRSVPGYGDRLPANITGNYLVVTGAGWSSITDITTMTTSSYTTASGVYPAGGSDIVNGSAIWISSVYPNAYIEGLTVPGGVSTYTYIGARDTFHDVNLCGAGDYVAVGSSWRLKVSTWAWTGDATWSSVADLARHARVGSTIYNVDASKQIRTINPTANTYSAVLHTLSRLPALGRGATIGNTVHFIVDASTRLTWDSVSGVETVWSLTPSGAPGASYHVAGGDGYLYSFVDHDYGLVVDPATGRWAKEAWPTSRVYRTAVSIAAGGGKVWVAASDPNPWP